MRLYAESSAVLSWLLGEARGEAVRRALAAADTVFASDWTLVESDRVLVRAGLTGPAPEAHAADRRAVLEAVSAHWCFLRATEDVVARARRALPVEPVRTLDALHLATALVLRAAGPGLVLLSVDRRLRECASALGFRLLPRESHG